MIQPKNDTEDLLLSKTRNYEKLMEQTHRKRKERLKFRYHFNPPIQIKGDWMIRLMDLEVYNSIFKMKSTNNNFELYTDNFESDFPFNELKDKVAEVLAVSDISTEDLEHEIYGLDNIKTYRKLSTEKSQTDGYYKLLLIYMHTPFRDFESLLRMYSLLDENDVQFILKQYNSNFIRYNIPPVTYTFKDLSDVFSRGFKNEFELKKVQPNHKHDESDSIIIQSDNVTLITKLILRPDIKVLRFDKKSFLIFNYHLRFFTILGL